MITTDRIQAVLESFGLDPFICNKTDCSDVNTPYGLAYVLTQEVYQFSLYDGWNADGSLSRDFNRIPYQDFRTSSLVWFIVLYIYFIPNLLI